MATQIRFRRGTTAQTNAFTGVQGEVTVDTDKKVVVVHDGVTPGGNPMLGPTNVAGKMDKTVYDPQNIQGDAFNRAIQTGSQAISTVTGLTAALGVYAAKSANYTAVLADSHATHRFTAAATVALTAAVTLGASWDYTVVAQGGDVVIDPNASETINGQLTLTVPNGTTAKIVCDGSTFFTVFKPAVWEVIGGPIDLTGLTLVDWTNLAAFRHLRLMVSYQPSVGTGAPLFRDSIDNGANFRAGASDYAISWFLQQGTVIQGTNQVTSAQLSPSSSTTDVSIVKINAELSDFNKATTAMSFMSDAQYFNSGNQRRELATGYCNSTVARNALRFAISAGTFTKGSIFLEGVRG